MNIQNLEEVNRRLAELEDKVSKLLDLVIRQGDNLEKDIFGPLSDKFLTIEWHRKDIANRLERHTRNVTELAIYEHELEELERLAA